MGESETDAGPDLARARRDLSAAERGFNRRSLHPVREVLAAGPQPFACYTHYPQAEVEDRAAGYFWYYHAHAPDDRPGWSENGHFHLFAYAALAGDAAVPLAAPDPETAGETRPFCHLLAISIDRRGAPCRLFTINRWASGETLYPADVVLPLALGFRLGRAAGHAAVSRWLSALIRTHAPQVAALLTARDQALAAHRARDPAGFAEDRALEVLSTLALDPGGA